MFLILRLISLSESFIPVRSQYQSTSANDIKRIMFLFAQLNNQLEIKRVNK